MITRTFTISLEVSESLTVDEIWPEGDAPENPTVEDVRRALFGSKHKSVLTALEDWGLLSQLRQEEVTITDDTAWRERMEALRAKEAKVSEAEAPEAEA